MLREGFSLDDYVAKYCYFPGEIQVEDGYITRLTGCSGHFEPGIYHMAQAIMVLAELGADLSNLERFYVPEHPEIINFMKRTSDGVAYIDPESVLEIIDTAYGPDSVYRP